VESSVWNFKVNNPSICVAQKGSFIAFDYYTRTFDFRPERAFLENYYAILQQMTSSDNQQPKETSTCKLGQYLNPKSWIYSCIEKYPGLDSVPDYLGRIRRKMSLMAWIEEKFKKPNNEAHNKKLQELYVYSWVLIEAVLYICLMLIKTPSIILGVIFSLIVLYRLSGIVILWVERYIFGPPEPRSIPRFIVLTLLNYLEIIVIFALFAYGARSNFVNGDLIPLGVTETFSPWFDSLRYSIGISTTLGSSFQPLGIIGHTIFFAQITLAILFVTVIIQIAVSLRKHNANPTKEN